VKRGWSAGLTCWTSGAVLLREHDELVLNEKPRPGESGAAAQDAVGGRDNRRCRARTPGDVPVEAVMFRVWRRHARYGQLSDSNLPRA
jgi:hypothetical protein